MWHLKRLPASEVALIDKSFDVYDLKGNGLQKETNLDLTRLNLKVAAECNVIWTQFMSPQVFHDFRQQS